MLRVPRPALLAPSLALVMLSLLASIALAQDRGIPDAAYFAAVEEMYRGDYRRAQRQFNNEIRGAVKTVNTRWIDSACFHAMLGETLYRQGRKAEALEQFDTACRHFLSNVGVFKRAQYPQLRAEASRVRRPAPWGRSGRQITRAQLPPTILVQFGRVNNQQQYETGGLVQSAQFWRLNLAEVVRTVALAIRRRTELLGPLSPHDPLSRQLDDRLSRGGIVPAGSWSNAWIDLLSGLAKLGVNKPKEAVNYLSRAILLQGQFDHPLTGVALLAQGELAAARGDRAVKAAAAGTLLEAGLAAFDYEDFDVVERALVQGHLHHTVAGVAGPYPFLDQAIRWADFQNYDPLSLRFRYAMAESLIAAGDPGQALSLLATRVRNRDVNVGPLPAQRQFLTAQALYAQGDLREAGDALNQAFALQATLSPRGLQTQAVNSRFDAGSLSARLAVQVYDRLLSDPAPADWFRDPHDVISSLRSPEEGAYARWFAARLGRREFDKAIEAADLAKRRRFFAALPMGGRLIALQRLLAPPPGALPAGKEGQALRAAWLAAHPDVNTVTQTSQQLRAELADAGPLLDGDRLSSEAKRLFAELVETGQQRERLLRTAALTRRPSPLGFPPAVMVADVQAKLRQGDALLMFHQAADAMSGFLIVQGGHHYWRLPNVKKTTTAVNDYLRELGVTGRQAAIDLETATEAADPSSRWRAASAKIGQMLLAESRLDLSKTERLIIVPDGPLWRLPFETLIAPDSGDRPLVDVAPLRIAPTLGLAVPSTQPMRSVRRSAVMAAKSSKSGRGSEPQDEVDRLLAAASFDGIQAEPLLTPLGTPTTQAASSVDLLVSTIENKLDATAPYAWQPIPDTRSAATLARWTRLGGHAPQRLVLGNLQAGVGGQQAKRRSRRDGAGGPSGNELFHASCGLLASGVRTVLMTRWTSDGLTQQNLLREFTAEAPHVAAPEAWQRSVALARETRLDPPQEPRLQVKLDEEPPLAAHPYFWGGFLLVDTSFDPIDATPPEPVTPKTEAN